MPDIRGLKRTCASCATKFYDFNKDPVKCPKCGTEFTGVVKIRTRRGRNIIEEAKAKAAQEAETTEVETDEATVSLEDLETEENEAVEEDDAAGGDLDLDDLDDDDDDEEDDKDDLEDLDEDIEVEEKE